MMLKQMNMNNNDKSYGVKKFSVTTKRYCQTLNLKNNPELIAEYRKIHSEAEAWPEIRAHPFGRYIGNGNVHSWIYGIYDRGDSHGF